MRVLVDPPSRSSVWLARARPWTLSIVLLPCCIYFLLSRGTYTFMDSADLIIHEAGHFFFGIFGRFLAIAGGTLMQIALPSLLAWHFLRNHYRTGAQVGLFWLGHNLINISVYAADARLRRLPLLGGDAAGHDWFNLLSMTGLLQYDFWIGAGFVLLAVAAFAACLAVPRYV